MKVRIKTLIVSPEIIIAMFRVDIASMTVLRPVDIPEGAIVRAVNHDYQRRAFALTVEHPSFDEVDDYIEPPEFKSGFSIQRVNLNNDCASIAADVISVLKVMLEKQTAICGMIEALPASPEATALSVAAAEVRSGLSAIVNPHATSA